MKLRVDFARFQNFGNEIRFGLGKLLYIFNIHIFIDLFYCLVFTLYRFLKFMPVIEFQKISELNNVLIFYGLNNIVVRVLCSFQ